MRISRFPIALLAFGALSFAALSPALAAPDAGPTALDAVTACRAIPAADARLACYDKAAADLVAADAAGDIVVLDRQKVETVKREAFGFNLPRLDLFGGKGEKPATLDRVEGVAKQAWQNGTGGWTIVLEDGAKWDQVGREPVRRAPKSGSKISIRRASMGSFFLNIDGQTAIRARRID